MSEVDPHPNWVSPEMQVLERARLAALREEGRRYQQTGTKMLHRRAPLASAELRAFSEVLSAHTRQMDKVCTLIRKLDAMERSMAFVWGAVAGTVFAILLHVVG